MTSLPNICNRCGKTQHDIVDSIHTCTPPNVDPTDYGHIEYWFDGTRHVVQFPKNPNDIFWRTKKHGINKK